MRNYLGDSERSIFDRNSVQQFLDRHEDESSKSDNEILQTTPIPGEKILYVPYRDLVLFIEGKLRMVNLPKDARIKTGWFYPERNAFGIIIESSDFGFVPEGCVLESFHALVERTDC